MQCQVIRKNGKRCVGQAVTINGQFRWICRSHTILSKDIKGYADTEGKDNIMKHGKSWMLSATSWFFEKITTSLLFVLLSPIWVSQFVINSIIKLKVRAKGTFEEPE